MKLSRLAAAALGCMVGLGTFAMVGCSSSGERTGGWNRETRSDPDTQGSYAWYLDRGEPTPAPAAEPAPRRAEPVAQTNTRWPTRPNCYSMAFPTGQASTSAVGLEKCVPSEVRAGQPFEAEMIVTNLTNVSLSDVTVRDTPGQNLRITQATPTGTADGGDLVWNLGTLGPNESKTIRLTGVATGEGEVGCCATVTYSQALCATIPVVAPKLAITKTGPAEVLRCDPFEYQIVVSNTGTGALRNVVVRDQLPAGLTTVDGNQQTITHNIPELKPGQRMPFTARVQAARTGRFENKATATGDGMTAESETVATVVKAPKLEIEKTCNETQFVGRPLDYTIRVRNTGDGVARNTTLSDSMAANATFVSASNGGTVAGNQIGWNLGDLAPGASREVTVRLNPAGPGTFRNTATARADCAEAVTASCQTVVTGIPAILLEVIDIEDPDEVGTTEEYVITVTNQGSAVGTGIRIVCTLEPNQEYVSSTGATTGRGDGNRVVFEPLASLAPKAQAVWRVTVRNVRPGDVRFAVTMTSDQLTRPVQETEATNVYELGGN